MSIMLDSTVPQYDFWNAAMPWECILPLTQYAGSVLKVQVHAGDIVEEGEVIGSLADDIPLHAPVPGKIKAIENHYWRMER